MNVPGLYRQLVKQALGLPKPVKNKLRINLRRVFQADVETHSPADAAALSRVLSWLSNLPSKDREFLFRHFQVKMKLSIAVQERSVSESPGRWA